MKLGVNIDHVATLRQARYARMPESPHSEPSLLAAALAAEDAGAHSITIHLREDRRHIQDADVDLIRKHIRTALNLEMGNAPEIVDISVRVRPDFACLVPESREEITTEGGLDVVKHTAALTTTTRRLQAVGTKVSFFIDPIPEQIAAAAACGADMVELHTGTYANALGTAREEEAHRLAAAGSQAHTLGMQVNAGHGITLENLPGLFVIPHLAELNVGHHLVSRAIFVGLPTAIREMLAVMAKYPA
jgi:pyridoxine 5-phosphate synthase